MYLVQTADSADLGALGDGTCSGRAAAISRRRALAAGRSAVAPSHERARTGFREVELRPAGAAVDATAPAARKGRGAASGTQRAPGGKAVAINPVVDAHLGRALSMQRRRQLSQGKQALDGGGGRPAAADGARAPAFIVHPGGG